MIGRSCFVNTQKKFDHDIKGSMNNGGSVVSPTSQLSIRNRFSNEMFH